MISLSNVIGKIRGTSSNFTLAQSLGNTFILPTNNYWKPGHPNPLVKTRVLFSSFSNMTTDASPTGWTKTPRTISFLNIGTNGNPGNIWIAHDYATLLARYPVDTFFYIVYKGRFFRLRFNSAATDRIRNTSFWYSSDNGSTWVDVPDASWIDTSPDGQTINGQFIAWNQPFINVTEVVPLQSLFVINTIGNSTVIAPLGTTRYDVLVVAGGGAGGGTAAGVEPRGSGGGGAGGVVYATNISSTPGTSFSVTVGAGGTPSTISGQRGNNGGNSVFGPYTATGGGGGGGSSVAGGNGGSGGGVWHGGGTAGTGVTGQGFRGGNVHYNSGSPTGRFGGTGGGGAGAVGGNATTLKGGDGGIGVQYNISGSNMFYGGGGGGGGQNMAGSVTASTGGQGGGGTGGASINGGTGNGGNATYFGGGGGGGAYGIGGNGFQGIVIVKFY